MFRFIKTITRKKLLDYARAGHSTLYLCHGNSSDKNGYREKTLFYKSQVLLLLIRFWDVITGWAKYMFICVFHQEFPTVLWYCDENITREVSLATNRQGYMKFIIKWHSEVRFREQNESSLSNILSRKSENWK